MGGAVGLQYSNSELRYHSPADSLIFVNYVEREGQVLL